MIHIITSLITGILKKLPQEEHVFHTPTELSNKHELDVPTDELPEEHVFDASSDELKKRQYDSLWLEVDGIKLNKTQKDILSSIGWLDDKIVNAAQSLLHKQFGLIELCIKQQSRLSLSTHLRCIEHSSSEKAPAKATLYIKWRNWCYREIVVRSHT